MSSNQPEYTMLFECFAQLGYTFPPEVEEEIIAATYLETYKRTRLSIHTNKFAKTCILLPVVSP